MHLKRIDSDISLWVDTGPLGPRTDISPFIGVRSNRVEDVYQRWLAVPRDKYVGTFGGNVGYVIDGAYRHFEDSASDSEVLEAIETGLRRYEPFLSVERLHMAEAIAGIRDPGRGYRLVVVHALRGDLISAREALANAEKEYCRRNDGVCEQFRGFSQRAKAEYPGL